MHRRFDDSVTHDYAAPVIRAAEGQPVRQLTFQPGLEGLRGVAVLVVVGLHLGEFLVPSISTWFFIGGYLGVDLFFALSGFLITSMLLSRLERTGRISYGAFIRRRFTRLYPAVLLFCGVLLVASMVVGDPLVTPSGSKVPGVLESTAWIATYTTNWMASLGRATRFDLLHFWTLGIEMQFYLVWPLVLVVLVRSLRTTARLVIAFVTLAAISAIVRYVEWSVWADAPFWPTLVLQRTEARLDALMMGAVVAVLWTRGVLPQRAVRRLAPLAGVLALIGVLFVRTQSPLLFRYGYAAAAVVSAVLIAEVLRDGSGTGRVLAWFPLRAVGRVSYSLYIWHLPIFIWLNRFGPPMSTPVRIAVAVGATAGITYVAWFIAERPTLHLPAMHQNQ